MIRVGIRFVTATLILAACGGGTAADVATTVSDPQAGTTTPSTTVATTRPDDNGEATTLGSAADRCDALFTTSEMTEVFDTEAVLDEASTDENLGQLVCVWTTPDKPDYSYDLLILQVYGGDPIPGKNFFDPSFYPDARQIDGIGDEALFNSVAPHILSLHFLDGDVYGTINYSEETPGNPDGPEGITDAQALDLLTKFHDRTT